MSIFAPKSDRAHARRHVLKRPTRFLYRFDLKQNVEWSPEEIFIGFLDKVTYEIFEVKEVSGSTGVG